MRIGRVLAERGVVSRYGVDFLVHRSGALHEVVVAVALASQIPHQVTVRRSGGTDAGSFHVANEGIPSVVIGVPARYIHSHNAIIDIEDQLNAVRLVQAMIRSLDEDAVAGFTSRGGNGVAITHATNASATPFPSAMTENSCSHP